MSNKNANPTTMARSWIYQALRIAKHEGALRRLLLRDSGLDFDKNQQLYINNKGERMSVEMALFCDSDILENFIGPELPEGNI